MDDNQNALLDYQHIGWIPCVLGSLDFSRVTTKYLYSSVSGPHTESICFSYINEHSIPSTKLRTRCNFATSIFDWKDRKDDKKEYDGLFRFLVFGESQSDGSMKGEAFLVLHDDIKQIQTFPKSVLTPLKELSDKISNYQSALKKNQYSPVVELDLTEVSSDIEKVKVAIRQIANNELKQRIFNIKYVIMKNGLTFLKTVDWLGQSNNPEHRDIIESTKYIADKQCFIYLKYSLHRHKHHNGQEDRLTSVHKIDHQDLEKTSMKLVEDLNRSLIEIKEREVENFESPDHYLQGFISYAKSLLQSLAASNLISKAELDSKNAYLDNMFWSWKAVASRAQKVKSTAKEKQDSDSKGIVEFFQAISILVATFSLLVHASINVLKIDNINELLTSTPYKNISEYFSSPVTILNVLTGLFVLIVMMVAGWIVWQPHGVVKRPLRWLRRNFKQKYLMHIVRAVIIAMVVFILGISIPR
ncbi:hypothetical protein A6F57_10365 [Alteromonas stellipolaris]|uniref:hypothetical protein n=1 Tax=Alteromonas stellipolaris TaxID=233316 RepID=UPI0007B4343D|nr:hypothetical protein [Alteromonas stellipolaris]ANB25566.1 hypothetical protein A6F57_10365 [Alteromonas stellipolaris]